MEHIKPCGGLNPNHYTTGCTTEQQGGVALTDPYVMVFGNKIAGSMSQISERHLPPLARQVA